MLFTKLLIFMPMKKKKPGWVDGLYFIGLGGFLGLQFVGMFIARISKGRTIREFMVGVLFLPTH